LAWISPVQERPTTTTNISSEQIMARKIISRILAPALLVLAASAVAQDKPNILVIWGDDIGQFNVSA
jgi:hypothetical protein